MTEFSIILSISTFITVKEQILDYIDNIWYTIFHIHVTQMTMETIFYQYLRFIKLL